MEGRAAHEARPPRSPRRRPATACGAPGTTAPPGRAVPTGRGLHLGDPDDYRIPDGGLHHERRDLTYYPSAALVVEILSPDDETPEKIPFYAEHQVDELLIVDPAKRTVDWLALDRGEYRAVERSRLIDLGPAQLAEQIDWP